MATSARLLSRGNHEKEAAESRKARHHHNAGFSRSIKEREGLDHNWSPNMQSTEDETRPTVDEKYVSASHASNLRVEAERTGSADIIIAAGWSPTRIGMALLRLASEWDGAAKKPGMSRTDINLLRVQLKSLTGVLDQLTIKMCAMKIEAPATKAPPITMYWLCQICQICHGRKFQLIRDTPALSAVRCTACRGAGVAHWPYGEDGKRVLAFLDACVGEARQSIKRRLRNY
jgi:hypothetical protein